MRTQRGVQGRFVSMCGLRKIACSPESHYDLIVVDSTGRPVSHVTEWYRLRKQPGAEGTRRTYLNFLLPFMGYLQIRGVAWNREPEYIRAQVKEFLRGEASCHVARDHDAEGYRVQLTGTSSLSQSGLRVFFAALRDFYLVMAEAGLYAYDNPMCSELLRKWKRERTRQIGNAGAPEHAGIRAESWEKTWQQPTAFFRLKRKQPWRPGLAQEPTLVLSRVKKALLTMIEQSPTQRDRIVLLLLHQTGARISEILGLTAGGYRKAKHACRALVTNKGSQGCEEKTIYFTPEIEHALVQYIRTERACYDSKGRKRLEQLADDEPIFLTRRGTPYIRNSLYYHWNRWLAAVPPDEYTDTLGPVLFSPHDVRHLYVSWIMRQMKQRYANQTEKLSALRWALQQRMGWRSPLTITCYDQSESDRERLEQFDTFLQEIERYAEQQVQQPIGEAASHNPVVLSTVGGTTSSRIEAPSQAKNEGVHQVMPVVQRDLSDLAFWEDGT